MIENCSRCGGKAEFHVNASGGQDAICPSCIDMRFPELQVVLLSKNLQANKRQRKSCPNCGCSGTDAVKSGLVGCPLCYEALNNSVWQHFGITQGS